MQDYIYLITVFEQCEPWKEPYNYILGDVRSVGWRPTLEMAVEAVETNMCDIWESCYDYACIEELSVSWLLCFSDKYSVSFHELQRQLLERCAASVFGVRIFLKSGALLL